MRVGFDVLDDQGQVRGPSPSKTDTAMINEAFGQILCHNVCWLNPVPLRTGDRGQGQRTTKRLLQ